MRPTPAEIGALIRKVHKGQGLTQEQLALVAGTGWPSGVSFSESFALWPAALSALDVNRYWRNPGGRKGEPHGVPFAGAHGVMVSPLALGCMNFGWGTSQEDSTRIIQRALDAGINLLDVADVYGDTKGESETVVGKALAEGGRRDHVVLATKVHGRMGDGPNDAGNSRYHIVRACEASLRRLGTDRIDLYQIHRPDPAVPIDETLRALDDLIRAGKVLYAGTSTFAAWQIVEALWVAKELGLHRFVSEQPPYNVLDRRIERELLPACRTYGLAVLPWSPMAGGLLSGKYKRGGGPTGSRYEHGAPAARGTDAAFEVVDRFLNLAAAKGCAPTALAVAWCMAQPGVTAPLIGPRTMDQLEDNLRALEVEITPDDRAQLDALVAPGTHVSGFYDGAWGPNARW